MPTDHDYRPASKPLYEKVGQLTTYKCPGETCRCGQAPLPSGGCNCSNAFMSSCLCPRLARTKFDEDMLKKYSPDK